MTTTTTTRIPLFDATESTEDVIRALVAGDLGSGGSVRGLETVLVVDELDLTIRIEAACALIARGQIDGLEGLSALREVDGGQHSVTELLMALTRRLRELR